MTAASALRPAQTSEPPAPPAPGAPQPGWPSRPSPRMLVTLLPSVLANIVAPVLAYSLLRRHVTGSAAVLLVTVAIPVGWTLAMLAWRRRVDWLGVASVAVSVIALGVGSLTGHSTLALELQDPIQTAVAGLACLVSVMVRRPLWLLVLNLLARGNTAARRMLADPAVRHTATVATAIMGAIFLVHAVAITVLALSVPTGTFLVLNRAVGLPLLAIGVAGLIWYRRRHGVDLRQYLAPQHPAPPLPRPDDDQSC